MVFLGTWLHFYAEPKHPISIDLVKLINKCGDHTVNISNKYPNKRVVITGSGSGLGRTLALKFAKLGWKVLISDMFLDRAKETEKLVNEAGGTGLAVGCDVTKWEEVLNLAKVAEKEWGGADIIVNNAGVPGVGVMEDIPLEDWRWIIDINLMGVIHGCKAFLPMFKKQGIGHIVNISSAAGIVSLAEMGPYNVTKAGVISLSETLRVELFGTKIGVTVVCPTFFKTNLLDQMRCTNEKQIARAQGFFKFSLGTANSVSRHIIRSIKRNRLYVVTQVDAKLSWKMKRYMPQSFYTLMGYVDKSGLLDKILGAK